MKGNMKRYNDLKLAKMLYKGTITTNSTAVMTGYTKTRIALMRRVYGVTPKEIIKRLIEYTPPLERDTPPHETGGLKKTTGWLSFEHLYEIVNYGINDSEELSRWAIMADENKMSIRRLRVELRKAHQTAIHGKWKRDNAGYVFFKHMTVCELMLKNGFKTEMEQNMFSERFEKLIRMCQGMILNDD